MKELFLLRKDVTFLNFGSFGACPKEILNKHVAWMRLLENEPVQFITQDCHNYLADSRKALAIFLNGNEDEFIFTPNPTFAINILAKNLKLNPCDEILSTNLEYGAMVRTWEYYAEIH